MLLSAVKTKLRRIFSQNLDKFLSDKAAEIDGFLVSYPKSGRTWLRFALSCYFAKSHGLGFEPDLRSNFRVLPNFDRTPDRGLGVFVGGDDPGLPLIAVSHRSYAEPLFGHRPVIFLIRDPRDVLVSAYFHETRHKQRFEGSISDFLENEEFGLPHFISYLNGWAAGLSNHRALIVSYEDMSIDMKGQLCRMLEFMNERINEKALAAAIEASQFDRMRSDEQKNGIPGHQYDRADTESLRMRKGKVGGFADHLSVENIDRLKELCRARLIPQARTLITHTTLEL